MTGCRRQDGFQRRLRREFGRRRHAGDVEVPVVADQRDAARRREGILHGRAMIRLHRTAESQRRGRHQQRVIQAERRLSRPRRRGSWRRDGRPLLDDPQLHLVPAEAQPVAVPQVPHLAGADRHRLAVEEGAVRAEVGHLPEFALPGEQAVPFGEMPVGVGQHPVIVRVRGRCRRCRA